MSFNWSEYFTLAQELTSKSATSSMQEAMLRSAISRAYYAAFCEARNHLIYIDAEIVPTTVNAHTYVGAKFKRSNDLSRRKIGRLLHHLRSIRNEADYQDKFYGKLRGRTRAALSEAEEVLRLLDIL